MTRLLLKSLAAILALATTLSGVGPSVAETPVGSTVESRVLLGFKVKDEAVQEILPQGWTSVTLPQGPVGGSNLIVALIDRHLILDADGKLGDPSSGPTVAFLAYGRREGVNGVRGFVSLVYEEPPVENPYGNSVSADIDRVSNFMDAGGGNRTLIEKWIVDPAGEGDLKLELNYKVGGFTWSTGLESRPYSSVNPDFFRIYRFDQLAGLAKNSAMGRELNGTVDFSVTIPGLAPLFDGSEKLVSIVSIPTFLRKISLP